MQIFDDADYVRQYGDRTVFENFKRYPETQARELEAPKPKMPRPQPVVDYDLERRKRDCFELLCTLSVKPVGDSTKSEATQRVFERKVSEGFAPEDIVTAYQMVLKKVAAGEQQEAYVPQLKDWFEKGMPRYFVMATGKEIPKPRVKVPIAALAKAHTLNDGCKFVISDHVQIHMHHPIGCSVALWCVQLKCKDVQGNYWQLEQRLNIDFCEATVPGLLYLTSILCKDEQIQGTCFKESADEFLQAYEHEYLEGLKDFNKSGELVDEASRKGQTEKNSLINSDGIMFSDKKTRLDEQIEAAIAASKRNSGNEDISNDLFRGFHIK